MADLKNSNEAVAGEALTSLSGFAPPLLLALGGRLATKGSQRNINTVTTNVPGPQIPLYVLGRKMLEAYPVRPTWRADAGDRGHLLLQRTCELRGDRRLRLRSRHRRALPRDREGPGRPSGRGLIGQAPRPVPDRVEPSGEGRGSEGRPCPGRLRQTVGDDPHGRGIVPQTAVAPEDLDVLASVSRFLETGPPGDHTVGLGVDGGDRHVELVLVRLGRR